ALVDEAVAVVVQGVADLERGDATHGGTTLVFETVAVVVHAVADLGGGHTAHHGAALVDHHVAVVVHTVAADLERRQAAGTLTGEVRRHVAVGVDHLARRDAELRLTARRPAELVDA